ncbi:glycosyltransferase family 2 protein [Vibrio mediterranei]|uniref:glycosyltransferase family 2 protein n=1 Tax=Vibrio mediterranei TaxID=689 RepID=UPI002283E708|nr:glycosyltransferase family 2 protein [Vibrio mediterranei]MCY9855130.1 glycosyltransferase family 2 protein [Vibrio mediterranei]
MFYVFLAPILLYLGFLLFYIFFLFTNRHIKKTTKTKRVLIIIPTYNDENIIQYTLDSIENLSTHHIVDILIINDGSTDNTLDKITQWMEGGVKRFDYKLHNVNINSRLKSIALSYAKPYIKDYHEVITVIDGDSLLEKDALSNAISKLFSKKKLAAVCGMILPKFSTSRADNITQRMQVYELAGAFHGLRMAQCSMNSISCLSGAFVVHKTEAISDVGWFEHWMVEDVCWTWKAKARKWQLGFCENSLVFTECPDKMAKLWKQRRRWSRGRVEALKAGNYEQKLCITISVWFILWLSQLMFIPTLLGLIFINPLVSLSAILTIYFSHCIYARSIYNYLPKDYDTPSPFVSAIWTSLLNDIFLFVPNILGALDEVLNREKTWLTR